LVFSGAKVFVGGKFVEKYKRSRECKAFRDKMHKNKYANVKKV